MEDNCEHIRSIDASGNLLSGEKNYRFHLPANIPAKNFWSVVIYDCQTSLVIKNGQAWPSVYSTRKGLWYHPDHSIDIWFGPEEPTGRGRNWIRTIPGKEWTMVFRLYGTMQAWHDQTWKPGEIEEIATP